MDDEKPAQAIVACDGCTIPDATPLQPAESHSGGGTYDYQEGNSQEDSYKEIDSKESHNEENDSEEVCRKKDSYEENSSEEKLRPQIQPLSWKKCRD
jgi:hypothetical protein